MYKKISLIIPLIISTIIVAMPVKAADISTTLSVNPNVSNVNEYPEYLSTYIDTFSYIPDDLETEFIAAGGRIYYTNYKIQYIDLNKNVDNVSFYGGVFNTLETCNVNTGTICNYYYLNESNLYKKPEIMLSFNCGVDKKIQTKIIAHEFGHFIDFGTFLNTENIFSTDPEWIDIFNNEFSLTTSYNDGVRNPEEFFADECCTYLLKDKYPKTYQTECQCCPRAMEYIAYAIQLREQQGTSWLNIPATGIEGT